MAEITKITTPMVPRENIGNKYKPVTDQAFDLTDPAKVHKPAEDAKIQNQMNGAASGESGRAMLGAVLRETTELVHVFHRMVSMLQMGISASEVMESPELKLLLDSLFVPGEAVLGSLLEQDRAAVLFKGPAFDMLRDLLVKFPDNAKLRDSVAGLLKAFEHNVNVQNSTRTILQSCYNLLDYMFSRDRAQFESYLNGLSRMLLPQEEPEAPGAPNTANDPNTPDSPPASREAAGERPAAAAQAPGARETAVILKNNLLPLLGEIVVKYNQNVNIRNTVMAVVHNIVRVDQGTPEALEQSVRNLVQELRQVANLSERFQGNLLGAVRTAVQTARELPNEWMQRMTDIISETLRSPELPPATVRQAEMLLFSMLQNQNSLMDILHFVLPMSLPGGGRMTAELYVNPDSGERARRSADKSARSRKLFLAFSSETHGSFELSFLQTERYVELSMWCPPHLVGGMRELRRSVSELMLLHGYTMSAFAVEELVQPKSIAEVFPHLLDRKVGVDVRV